MAEVVVWAIQLVLFLDPSDNNVAVHFTATCYCLMCISIFTQAKLVKK